MAKPENDDSFPEKQTWGTWEELLLACAVHRHGTESWSSVSAEIQKRSPNLRSLTASACRHKYLDLKRRFTEELALPVSAELESATEISTVPWLEELRKLRVDELRREVEQYDLSISSLQSKVKRLEEEREVCLNEPDTEIEDSDLNKTEEKKERRRESDSNFGEPVLKPVEETISPDPKDNSPGTGSVNAKKDGVVDGESNGVDDGGEAKLAGEDSCRGSCESVEKESAGKSERVEPGRGTELTESMAESEGRVNRGESKETSEVQSSASLLRKGTSEQNEPDNDDQSPGSAKDFSIESQPSISFVENLLAHPCGSHFSRRLQIQLQETPEYDKIIKQHIDFEIIRKRVEQGCYKSSRSNFFRDLLLLINNARVFYHKRSSEFKSAEQLCEIVKKQMTITATLKRPRDISPPKEKSLELVPFDQVVACRKPSISVPIVACRKRSSLAAKPLMLLPPGPDKKADHVEVVDEKQVSETGEDEKITRTSKVVAIRNVKNRDTSLSVVDDQKKTDEEKKASKSSSKKKSAANFLERMKVDTVVETLKKKSCATDSGKGGAEERKNNSGNKDVDAKKREAAPSSSSSSSILAKRSRDAGEKEAASSSSSTRLNKRVRR